MEWQWLVADQKLQGSVLHMEKETYEEAHRDSFLFTARCGTRETSNWYLPQLMHEHCATDSILHAMAAKSWSLVGPCLLIWDMFVWSYYHWGTKWSGVQWCLSFTVCCIMTLPHWMWGEKKKENWLAEWFWFSFCISRQHCEVLHDLTATKSANISVNRRQLWHTVSIPEGLDQADLNSPKALG